MNLSPAGSHCPWRRSLSHSWICKKTIISEEKIPWELFGFEMWATVVNLNKQLKGAAQISLEKETRVILESRYSSHVGEGGM